MPTSKNDITGDAIRSKAPSDEYKDNYDRIFGKKTAVDDAADVMSGWTHDCKVDGLLEIEKGSACNWCGEKEDGTKD